MNFIIISLLTLFSRDEDEELRILFDFIFQLHWTPLMIAVSIGQLEIVRMLLQTNKVDIEQSNSTGARPLHYACSKNFYEVKRTKTLVFKI